jgi:hypothetical protein
MTGLDLSSYSSFSDNNFDDNWLNNSFSNEPLSNDSENIERKRIYINYYGDVRSICPNAKYLQIT